MDDWMNAYTRRVEAERLARQAPDVQRTAKEILEVLKSVEQYMRWSLNPAEKDGGAYYCQNLLERAHELVDLAHEFRAAFKANPPPKEDDDDDDAA